MKKVVGIIDYGMGNITSIQNVLDYLGINSKIVNKKNELNSCSHLILPGVGSFKKAMKNIKRLKLIKPLKNFIYEKKKILGICLGMQLLGRSSDEINITKGLGFVNFEIKKFKKKKFKVPHIGFNSIIVKKDKFKFFDGIPNKSDFYFNHSYRAINFKDLDAEIICDDSEKFLAAFQYKNIFGTQFHPEKSQSNGLKLLKNFFIEC